MKATLNLLAFLMCACLLISCSEGEDAALFNNTNELNIIGTNTANFFFNHDSTLMITHLHIDSSFTDIPFARISQDWREEDDQGNFVAVNETSVTHLNAASPNDYFALSFIDVNRNSEPDFFEPYSEWRDPATRALKVIPVREESRWIIEFQFTEIMESYQP